MLFCIYIYLYVCVCIAFDHIRYNIMVKDERNMVIYKRSDLLYDPWNSTCGSGASAKMKLIQVCVCVFEYMCMCMCYIFMVRMMYVSQESGALPQRKPSMYDQIRRKKRQGTKQKLLLACFYSKPKLLFILAFFNRQIQFSI